MPPTLPCVARLSLASFVRQGWTVKLWTYHHFHPPADVELCNAADILPFAKATELLTAGLGVAQLSDYFRLLLLSCHPGWWVDSDTLCLQPPSVTLSQVDSACAGFAIGSLLAKRSGTRKLAAPECRPTVEARSRHTPTKATKLRRTGGA